MNTIRPFLTLLMLCTTLITLPRQRLNFDNDWRFLLADSAGFQRTHYRDLHWRPLTLPHDWAVEGDFSAGNPSGAGGGALPGGVGWYRKAFDVSLLNNEKLFLEFDGVYSNASVFINGRKVGAHPYGYSSFVCDISTFVRQGRNLVAVRVDNAEQPNSRWYSGCGIYRHVWLTRTHQIHIKHWGVYVHDGKVDVDVDNPTKQKVTVRNTWLNADGKPVNISKPHLWSVHDPYVYKVKTQLLAGGKVVDEVITTTGFRNFRFDAKTGFWLNGRNVKINGVCEHHDLGCLGAALNEDALHRKLSKLKAMGVNAIRTAHNPPAPELLNMCDTMGIIVMDESFDMWRRRKTQNDYARFFDEWHERDLTDMVLRDRNHPAVLMWSIGNEVLEQWSDADADTLTLEQANLILNAGHDAASLARQGEMSVQSLLTRHLADIVRRYDSSRPITAGCNEPDPGNHLFRSGALDIIGYNYHHEGINNVTKLFPGMPFIMTESVSALQTTGFYRMPSDSVYKAPVEWWLPYTDPSFMCSAYDNMHASWSTTHEQNWDAVKHAPHCCGQFIWTGFDYIGEPTPYGFPARSSYFGIIDLSGQPKDVYYMYQSEWTNTPVLHLFPHWNWLEGQTVDMWCYYNQADEVELFVNGKSQGVRRKADSHQFHVAWRVSFEPGEVQVVARQNGQVVRQQTIRTAGQPHHIQLNIDYQGRDLTFVQAVVVDKDGNRCPWAENQLFFTATDGAKVIATDNGCQTSMERFTEPQRKAFFGRCIAVVKGRGSVKASAIGLNSNILRL